jgi:chemosensory pili system protein ChpA (sensor histidine kinase/response regulator)
MTVMREAIDTTTLGWIKPELDETLRLAQQEIEAYAEDPADAGRMRLCAEQLHQVHGTLRMVELYAPAMVAEEMERLAIALQHGKVADRDEACAALMRGVVLLPDYLERLQGGHRDIPIVLLPLLNELRATRGEAGLNESVLFAPDLDRPLPANLPSALPSNAPVRGASSSHLAALRDALATWPEEGNPAQPEKLANAVDGLLGEVILEPVRRMLWVASSVAGALRDGALPPTRALRQAFGGVEREARLMLADDGFGAHRSEPAAEPTRQLLYHVAHSDGRHPALDDLRHTFELAAHLPSESELEHARGSLSGRNRALLDTVAAAIKEDLLRVKDALDLHLRTGQTDVAELKPQVEALGRVSDTLGMMGLGVARTVVLQQRDAMHEIVSGKRPADEGALLDVAGALLYVDASLDDQVSRLGLPDSGAEDDLLAGEARKVLDVLVREAIANFGDARQAFVAFVETNWDHAELAEVPRVLDEVAGALRMLELSQPADYLAGVKRYTEVELIGRKRVPNGQQLDTLADALASLEYYLEALREQRPNRNHILDITRQSLEALRYWPLPEFDIAATMAPSSPISREELARVPDFELTDEITLGTPPAPAFDASALAPSTALAAEVPVAQVSAVAPVPTPAPVANTPQQIAAGGFEHSDDIDDEIREVFLEELDEEIRHLGDLLPVWHALPEDSERLRPIRRVFHTLKGSGRLVGAKTLGEFSWRIENLLNRVLDGTRPASPAVIGLVGHAYAALPQLHAALRNEGAITADLAGMETHAERLAEGDETLYTPAAPKLEAVVEPVVDAIETVEPVADAIEPPVEAVEPMVEAVEPVVEPVAEEITLEAVSFDGLDGGTIEVEEIDFDDVQLVDAAPVLEPEPGMPASVDSVLLEILDAEVSGHLVTIEQWLADSQAQPRPADDGLQRAFHTLNGAFAMTEVPVITDITGPTEVYVKRLLASGQPASAEGVSAMGAVAEAIRRTLATLKTPAPRIPAFEGLADRMRALRDSLPDARQPMPADAADASGIETSLSAFDLSEFTELADDAGPDYLADSSQAARIEAELAEASRIEAEREAIERANSERVEIERLEAERFALEEQQREAERLALLRREEEARLEAERRDAEQLENERIAAEQAEAERLAAEAERVAAEQAEAERLAAEAERIAAEQAEAERIAAEEAQRAAAAERAAAAALAEQQRIEADLLEAERIATERLESERFEAARIADEEAEYARLEAEYAEADRAAREQQAVEATVGHAFVDAPAIGDMRDDLPEVQEFAQDALAEAPVAVADESAAAASAATPEAQEPAVAALIAHALASNDDPDEALDLSGLDPELVDIFVEEASDLLDHSDGLLAQLREAPTERESLVGLQRDLHTIKGGARMAGIMAVGELGHAMESLLEAVVESRCELGRDGVPLLERGFDRLHAMVTRVGERRAIGMPEALIAEFDARARGETTLRQLAATVAVAPAAKPVAKPAAAPTVETSHADADETHADLKPLSAPISDQPVGDEDDIGVRAPQEQVRIRADLLDRLVNYAGEVAIYRARLEQQLGAFRGAIAEMAATNTRMRDQLRRLEIETEAQIVARYQREGDDGEQAFDPLELDQFSTLQQLSRALAESAADQTSLQNTLDDLTRQYETLLLQQSRVSSELQEGLMRTRMVPFDGLLPRLRRVVRQASGELGKHVALKLDGTQGELDRNVLERMTAPLEHMLRNAVAHGLETPDKRKKAGKSDEGTIRIAVRREGSEVVLEVGDDGAGLNRQAILRRGHERGLVPEGATLSDAAIDALILEPGFSTAESVSRLSGRGVGMDVVASEVRQLGGTLDIHSVPGKGVTFTLRLPQTLAVTQAVFVRIGETTFAVPIASVRGVGRIARDRLDMVDATYRYGGEDYAVHDLGALVGHGTAKAEGHLQMPLLLIRSGDLRAAVCVDQVVGNREIVVKPVGPQVASVPGIFGATIMGDGRVVVILDVAPLVRRQQLLPRDHVVVPEAPVETRRVPLVMVVDDSVTMRKVTGRVLERHNFEVLTAKDGIDALERMTERVPDLMLLDIEMPRMDGYELATAMKGDARLRGVPIVMITSRTGDKHRQRAFEIGVERYLGKPYQETELVRNVYELLGINAGATRNE